MSAARSAIGALAVATLCLAGCSSTAPASNAPADEATSVTTSSGAGGAPAGGIVGGAAGAITLRVTVNFTSPYAITDTYDWTFDPTSYAENDDDSPVPANCADLAKSGTLSGGQGNQPSFQTPNPPDDGTMSSGQNSLMLQADVDSYSGPKTYTGADVDGSAGLDISNTPELPDNGGGDLTFSDAEQTSSITVNADGSGTTTIVGWQDAGDRRASGTLTWTCSG